MITQQQAEELTDIVINNFEGGYYHPIMKQYLKGGDKMGISGETMYGIDFEHGGSLGQSQFAQEVHNYFYDFVSLINDNASAVKIYNDKADGKKVAPAEKGRRWRTMVASLMLDLFKQYIKWLTPEAQTMVLSDPALLLQFWYAVWNGAGNFQKFAEVMNRAYNAGERNPQNINVLILVERYKKPWNTTKKMDEITASYYGRPNMLPAGTNDGSKKFPWWLLLLGGGVLLFYLKSRK